MLILLFRKLFVLTLLCLLSREESCPFWFLGIWASLNILTFSLKTLNQFTWDPKEAWVADCATAFTSGLLYLLNPGDWAQHVLFAALLLLYLKDILALYSYLKALFIAEIYS